MDQRKLIKELQEMDRQKDTQKANAGGFMRAIAYSETSEEFNSFTSLSKWLHSVNHNSSINKLKLSAALNEVVDEQKHLLIEAAVTKLKCREVEALLKASLLESNLNKRLGGDKDEPC